MAKITQYEEILKKSHYEDVWNKTHRFAGLLWIICGVILLINAFLDITWIVPVCIATAVFLPTGYSFLLFMKQTKNTEK